MTTKEKNWKVIELPNNGRQKKKSWFDITYVPYTTTFVYSKDNGNFIVKGYSNDVKDYLKENHTHYFYNMVMHKNGKTRNVWCFWRDNWYIFSGGAEYGGRPRRVIKNRPFRLRKKTPVGYRGYNNVKEYTFKRMPSRWIPLMDKCK